MLTLSSPVSAIPRVGPAIAKKLNKLDIFTVKDLLFYFPFCYDNFSETKRISDLKIGETTNIIGRIELIQNKRSPRRRVNITECLISDDSGMLRVIWFNQPFIAKNLVVGDLVSFSGRVSEDYAGASMTNPIYEKNNSQVIHTQGLVPNYHLTADLGQKQLRSILNQVIALSNMAIDWLPEKIRLDLKLANLTSALKKIHFPNNQIEIDQARERLGFDEFFILQLKSQLLKRKVQGLLATPLKFFMEPVKEFVNSLPFELTSEQKQAAWEILQDLEKEKPMLRLLEGDVGSGKTIVAALAIFSAFQNKQQSALMVPTEILAKQHFESLSKIFNQAGLKIILLTNSYKQASWLEFKNKKEAELEVLKLIKAGEVDLVIGTHALIQSKVDFKSLDLVIIDEQHRFGVEQRRLLTAKSVLMPHLLSMTATPIPRSLALALYGDLDISLIKHKPAQRLPITTKIVKQEQREALYGFLKQEVAAGRQVFVICPLVDVSDKLGYKSAKAEADRLQKEVFPDLEIGLVHGKLKSAAKEQAMTDFASGKTQILVATAVVEVGIDVSNASVMVIEDAERFGLAQLHQYRGRVGRGVHQSYCFLLSENLDAINNQRLQAMLKYDNGFDLAKADLEFRGPGEVYGLDQKGFPELKIANLMDFVLIKKAQTAACKFLDHAKLEDYPLLLTELGEWEKTVHLE